MNWRLRAFLRLVTGHHGAFREPELSARAASLTGAWQARFGDQQPRGYFLRDSERERWVRFHSLPESKRYAESASEHAQVFERHRVVLEQLSDGGPLVVIAADWDWRDMAAGWTRALLPKAWPWRASRDEPDEPMTYFWVAEFATIDDLRPLLRAVADDVGNALITAETLDWAYCPYDGGADVIAASPADRDRIARSHADWLPQNEAGL